jgi:hypothetical protein
MTALPQSALLKRWHWHRVKLQVVGSANGLELGRLETYILTDKVSSHCKTMTVNSAYHGCLLLMMEWGKE